MTVETIFVEANGLRFACLVEGEGPLVLLLHGFPDTAHSWDAVRPAIAARGYRAVSPFMRGYDPTGIPEKDADQETLAHDAIELVLALGANEAIVIAHDWGATAAYGAAALAPERVKKLVTIAIPHPASIAPSPGRAWAFRHFMAYKIPGAAGRFAKNDFAALVELYKRWSPAWSPPPEEFAHVRACFANRASLEAAFGYYRALVPWVPKSMKHPIEVPTVSFAGTDDPIMSPGDFRNAERWFARGYTVETLPGGHFLHREHPDLFRERLLAHL